MDLPPTNVHPVRALYQVGSFYLPDRRALPCEWRMGDRVDRFWMPLVAAFDPHVFWPRSVDARRHADAELEWGRLCAWKREIDARAETYPTHVNLALQEVWSNGVRSCRDLVDRIRVAPNPDPRTDFWRIASTNPTIRDVLGDLRTHLFSPRDDSDSVNTGGTPSANVEDMCIWDEWIEPRTFRALLCLVRGLGASEPDFFAALKTVVLRRIRFLEAVIPYQRDDRALASVKTNALWHALVKTCNAKDP